MTEPAFTAWRTGRSGFSRWHIARLRDKALCGAQVPPTATWTKSGVPNQDICTSCLEVLANEAQPEASKEAL